MGGHRQVDHTADLAIEIWAADEAALLCEGARAVSTILTEGALIDRRETRAVKVRGIDREDRLVQWLNEIIYLAVSQGFVVVDAEVVLEGDDALFATVFGESGAGDKVTTELKSATYHDLEIVSDGDQVRARVVIDV